MREVDRREVGIGSAGKLTQTVQRIYASGVRGGVDWMRSYITPYEF